MRFERFSSQMTMTAGTFQRRRAGAWYGVLLGCFSLLSACGADQPSDSLSGDVTQSGDGAKGGTQVDGNTCSVTVLGDDTSCKGENDWRADGAQLCSTKGLRVDHVSFTTSCGTGTYRHAEIKCCPKLPEPPPPPPPPSQCNDNVLGDDTSCKNEDAWKTSAAQLCDSKGQRVDHLAFTTSCGTGEYRHAAVRCCPKLPPPPPPPACTPIVLGDDTSCKNEDAWKTAASQACSDKGLRVDNEAFTDSCGTGEYRHVKVNCCK